MKKTIMILLAVLMLAGCSKSVDSAENAYPLAPGSSPYAQDQRAEAETEPMESGGFAGQAGAAAQGERKLIQNAEYTMETLDLDAAMEKIEQMVAETGGYVQDSAMSGAGYGRSRRYASYTLRIPADQLAGFSHGLGDCGNLVYSRQYTEEVTDYYYDTEARLHTLQVQERRLLELLEQAEKLEDVISLEDRLSSVRYEIESSQGSLRRLDSLISLSTVNLTVNEVTALTDTDNPNSIGGQIAQKFRASLAGLGSAAVNALVFLAGNVLYLAMAAVVAVAGVLAYRRRRRRLGAPRAKEEEKPEDKK